MFVWIVLGFLILIIWNMYLMELINNQSEIIDMLYDEIVNLKWGDCNGKD
jgi:hypothetical protein